MKTNGVLPRRNSSINHRRTTTATIRNSVSLDNGISEGDLSKPSSPPQSLITGSDRTVKKLRLSRALTISEGTTVADACCRMASRRVNAVLITDANALLSGILTDKDIATRVIAEGLRPEQTAVSKIMTRHPTFVKADSLAIEALQTMVQGKFRHLPVVENGEVIALLDITKCLYDAISRMEKAMEQGGAIVAAVENVEKQWGNDIAASSTFVEALRERMFRPSLSTIITENSKVAIVLPSDPVHLATKRMKEFNVSSVLVMAGNRLQGVLTSKDVLMRIVARNLSPELTTVEKVMTADPECATLDTTVLDALHIMRDGKFLHLPVLDNDGRIAACVDVLQITQVSISLVEGGSSAVNDMTSIFMHKFWDSALSLEAPDCEDKYDACSVLSATLTSEPGEDAKSVYPCIGLGNLFSFKFCDHTGHMHRICCDAENFNELVSKVMQRLGPSRGRITPQLLYEDFEGDKVLISTDADLSNAVIHARSVGWKVLRLHVDFGDSLEGMPIDSSSILMSSRQWTFRSGILIGAAVATSICMLVYLKHSR